MRCHSLLAFYLLLSLCSALAQDQSTPTSTSIPQTLGCKATDGGQTICTQPPTAPTPAAPPAQLTSTQSPTPIEQFSFRLSDREWKRIDSTAADLQIQIEPRDGLALLARGDCTSPSSGASANCSPFALMVQTSKDVSHPSWRQLLRRDGNNLYVVANLDPFFQNNAEVRVVINGKAVIQELKQPPGPAQQEEKEKLKKSWENKQLDSESDIYIEIFKVPDGCRDFVPNQKMARLDQMDIPPTLTRDRGPQNGITLGSPKIFDSFALRQKLASTVAQLSSINPFSQAQITAQIGSFQGITRDTSYLAAQLTTTPTPGIVNTANAGTGNEVTTTNQTNTAGSTVMQATCPPGYLPTLTAANAVSCTYVGGTTVRPVSGQTTTLNPATTQTVNTATQPTLQVQTTTPSITGTVPTAPTLNPIAPPSNVGISGADVLDLQMQLSSQLTTLQLLLQGASSDQLLLGGNQRAFGVRSQTTIGFPISVETPRRYQNAVAEVRMLVLPRQTKSSQPRLSIVNLLPSEKTYNVAKVTSNAKQFGAGVAIQPISFGFTTGKSKDRLYLAKDTDTVALQYPPAGHLPTHRYWFEPKENPECGDVPPGRLNGTDPDYANYDFDSAVMFGWQFRPVLGASAVAASLRTAFAQLALPSDGLDFKPEVWVQTRWRKYSSNKQIASFVFPESCHWRKLKDPVSISNPIVVKNVQVTDAGQGLLRFRATGDFFSSTGQLRSGSLTVAPQFFDGYSIEYFQLAKDLLSNGDLRVLDEAMHPQPLVIPSKIPGACRITNPKLSAVPMSDGTSNVQLEYDRSIYDPSDNADGPQHPLLLIGSDVYGLRDKPLQPTDPTQSANTCAPSAPATATTALTTHCIFSFVAPTDSLRTARNFLVRDPAWDADGATGTIAIDPTFTKLEAAAKPAKSADGSSGDDTMPGCPKKTCAQKQQDLEKQKKNAAGKPKPTTWYLLSGTNLSLLKKDALPPDPPKPADPAPVKPAKSKPAKSKPAPAKPAPPETAKIDFPSVCTKAGGCLQIFADGSDGKPAPVPADNIKFVSDTTAWLNLPQSVGVHVFWSRPGRPTAEWDLAVKTEDKPDVTASPAVLYVADSRAVTFTGPDFSSVKSVTYEGDTLLLPTDPTKSKLVVQVTTIVTRKYGHKELVAHIPDNGKDKTISLPLDVVQH